MDFHSHPFRAVDGKEARRRPPRLGLDRQSPERRAPSRPSKVSHVSVCLPNRRVNVKGSPGTSADDVPAMADADSRDHDHRAIRKALVRAGLILVKASPSSRVDSKYPYNPPSSTNNSGQLHFRFQAVFDSRQIRTGGGRRDMPIATHRRIRSARLHERKKVTRTYGIVD